MAHNQEMGICTSSRDCPEIVALHRQGLKYTTCSYIGGQHIVCCPVLSGAENSNKQAPNSQATSYQAPQNFQAQQAVNPSRATSAGGRISVQSKKPTSMLRRNPNIFCVFSECEEYKLKVTKVTGFAALVLNPKVHQISAKTCDFSTGLIVGGVKATIGEFPHMAALAIREPQRFVRFLIFRLIFIAF